MKLFEYTDEVLFKMNKSELEQLLKEKNKLGNTLHIISCNKTCLLNNTNINIDEKYIDELRNKLSDLERNINHKLYLIEQDEERSQDFNYYIHQLNLSLKYANIIL